LAPTAAQRGGDCVGDTSGQLRAGSVTLDRGAAAIAVQADSAAAGRVVEPVNSGFPLALGRAGVRDGGEQACRDAGTVLVVAGCPFNPLACDLQVVPVGGQEAAGNVRDDGLGRARDRYGRGRGR
jgi:hypothetical protein